MTNLHRIYDIILSNLLSYKPKLIYFSVGSALGHWDKIKPNENQQYPFSILEKDNGKKKVIILMDKKLESPLKIESDIKLNLIDQDENFRILSNNEDTIIFAINHHYYFDENPYLDKYEFQKHYEFLMDLIGYTLSNNLNNKLIIQNFAGPCIQNSCINMFNYFPKYKLIENVIFDVSNSDGNCGFNFDNFPIRYDDKDNFIQIKFNNLSVIKKIDTKYFSQVIVKRIDSINYALTRKLRVIRGELEIKPFENENIQTLVKSLSIIYPEIYTNEDSNNIITEDSLMNIIKVLITDICYSLNVDKSLVSNLAATNFSQKEVINALSPLKMLI